MRVSGMTGKVGRAERVEGGKAAGQVIIHGQTRIESRFMFPICSHYSELVARLFAEACDHAPGVPRGTLGGLLTSGLTKRLKSGK